jgi:hypothetical protein
LWLLSSELPEELRPNVCGVIFERGASSYDPKILSQLSNDQKEKLAIADPLYSSLTSAGYDFSVHGPVIEARPCPGADATLAWPAIDFVNQFTTVAVHSWRSKHIGLRIPGHVFMFFSRGNLRAQLTIAILEQKVEFDLQPFRKQASAS